MSEIIVEEKFSFLKVSSKIYSVLSVLTLISSVCLFFYLLSDAMKLGLTCLVTGIGLSLVFYTVSQLISLSVEKEYNQQAMITLLTQLNQKKQEN